MAIQDTAIGKAVYAATPNQNTRIAMILGALLEGGSLNGPWGVGDNGTSFGPWQIHLPAHPGVTAAEASDPMWAARYMAPVYERVTFAGVLGSTMQAAANTVFKAERPAQMYPLSRIQSAWAQMHGQVSGAPGGGMPVADSFNQKNPLSALSSLGTIATDFEKLGKFLSNPHTWVRIMEFILGGAMILYGVGIVSKPVWEPVANTAAKLGGTAAGAAIKAP